MLTKMKFSFLEHLTMNQPKLRIVTLNVMYDPFYDNDHPWHFWQRWETIKETINGADIICLQEVHLAWVDTINEFARDNGYIGNWVPYGGNRRNTHLITMLRPCMISGDKPISAAHKTGTNVRGLITKFTWCEQSITLYNVHLPLSLRRSRNRFAATKSVIDTARLDTNAIIIGDWNTIMSHRMRQQQIRYAQSYGTLATWKHVPEAPTSTFYGSPREEQQFRGYTTSVELDQAFVRSHTLNILDAECRHTFVSNEIAVSDHMPCYVTIGLR